MVTVCEEREGEKWYLERTFSPDTISDHCPACYSTSCLCLRKDFILFRDIPRAEQYRGAGLTFRSRADFN